MVDIPVKEGLGETLVTITANGQTVLAFDFLAFAADQVRAEYRPAGGVPYVLNLNTDYTVSGLGQPNGGELTLVGISSSIDDQVYIYRLTPIEREKDWQNEGDYKADLVNREQDEIYMIMQELDRDRKNLGAEAGEIEDRLEQEIVDREAGDAALSGRIDGQISQLTTIKNEAVAAASSASTSEQNSATSEANAAGHEQGAKDYFEQTRDLSLAFDGRVSDAITSIDDKESASIIAIDNRELAAVQEIGDLVTSSTITIGDARDASLLAIDNAASAAMVAIDGSVDLAFRWASLPFGEEVIPGMGYFSALHWAKVAEEFAGGGTVNSVGLSAPTGFTVSNSPVTGSGTLTITYASGYQGYTTAEATKLSGIAAGAQVNTVTSVAGRTGAVTLAKADVSLGNADNTSDAQKVASGPIADALSGKQTSLGYTPVNQLGGTMSANASVPLGVVTKQQMEAAIAAVQQGGVGIGQTWQSVSRSVNMAYQNTTGRPLQVAVTVASTSLQVAVSANNSTWVSVGGVSTAGTNTVSFIVPTGHYYRVYRGAGSAVPEIWAELY